MLKHDLVTGHTTVCDLGPDRRASEFVFVPASAGAAEDEGVLLGFVYNAETDCSDLTILDAGTCETVAQVHLPVRVPNGFHGNWAPSSGN